MVVYTIGHSTHVIDRFVDLLRRHDVAVVADVRSSPYSRFNPQFNRETLAAALASAGLRYEFMGDALGARRAERECYVESRVDFARVAAAPAFIAGLDRVEQIAAAERTALMCAEKDPLVCHRTILVARGLVARGVDVQHIRDDGRLESHDAAMMRLIAELGLPPVDLFRSSAEMVDEAVRLRGAEIAYTNLA